MPPAVAPADSVYDADGVDEAVQPRQLAIEGMIVEASGRIDRCSIAVLQIFTYHSDGRIQQRR